MPEKLILHIGSGKTGTSAIQTGLARHKDLLLEHGIYYPCSTGLEKQSVEKALHGKITSGNGIYLNLFLNPSNRSVNFQESEFYSYFEEVVQKAQGNTILFSDERIHNANPERLLALDNYFRNFFDYIEIIYYVRHITDHAMSLYMQKVKRHGYYKDFSTFIKKAITPFKKNLEKFEEVFGKSNISIYLYDEQKEDIFNKFLKNIGLSISPLEKIETINRSLDRQELLLLQKINELDLPMNNISEKISDKFIYSKPKIQAENTYFVSTEELSIIKKNNQDIVDFINNSYFKGEERLKIHSDQIVVLPHNQLSHQDHKYEELVNNIVLALDSVLRPLLSKDKKLR